MTIHNVLRERRNELLACVRENFKGAVFNTKGFVLRLFGESEAKEITKPSYFDFTSLKNDVMYEGFPYLAYLGFGIGAECHPDLEPALIDAFVLGLNRLKERSRSNLQDFIGDDIAVLGVADGIVKLLNAQVPDALPSKEWLLELLHEFSPRNLWSDRIRDLAGDLLDNRGRLRETVDDSDPLKLALEMSFRDSWPSAFFNSVYPDRETRNGLLKSLLIDSMPQPGDIELASVCLKALDLLINDSIETITVSVSDIVRILQRTQYSLKRWVWDENHRRRQVNPAQWLIDNEYHVQSLLWAVLYPIFGKDLVDEKYLPDFGQVQPKVDLGIIKLKLIIEVKIVRERGDFAKIEEQVAGDLGLYFKELDKFDRMIVYVYDDCDIHFPERYDALRNALKSRERIEDVIFVRRPSMIPGRNQRG